MDSDLLRILCALAAFALPMAFAWFIVWRGQAAHKAYGRAATLVAAAAQVKAEAGSVVPCTRRHLINR